MLYFCVKVNGTWRIVASSKRLADLYLVHGECQLGSEIQDQRVLKVIEGGKKCN